MNDTAVIIVFGVLLAAAIGALVVHVWITTRAMQAEMAAHRREIAEYANRLMSRHAAEYALAQSRLDGHDNVRHMQDREPQEVVGL